MNYDIVKELGTNFIEYAVAVNSDRSIPDARTGLKPVAKRILYGAYVDGNFSNKPHVKSASIVGTVMGKFHPHGDSSIYGALVRFAQPWVMRYPLIDIHGNMGNIDGDGPAAMRYTDARLSKLAEEGMLAGIKKNNVEFGMNYDEKIPEPVTLPSLFPNLLCNPNSGIGVAIACSWMPHNLREVAQAIYDYMDGKEPMLPGPDFPTGGQIINKNDIPQIMKTGKGSVKVRARYKIENDNIIFYEIPYGLTTESILDELGIAAEEEKIKHIKNIRNESNKKGLRIVIECEKKAPITSIINSIYKETSLQTSISYNQVGLVNKTPTELNLKDCIEIYIKHNISCITKESLTDKEKIENRIEIVNGLLKALEDIDKIITLIKESNSSTEAKDNLKTTYNFTENQAKAIVDMKLGRLAGLERIEIQEEKAELLENLEKINSILTNPEAELRIRLADLVNKFGDERRTELTQISISKEDKEIEFVEPEKCVVIMTESGNIKRIPSSSFRTQKRNGKGVKTQDDITNSVIRTNTIDSLMVFTDQGQMYRLLVNDIPVGTNTTKGQTIRSLVSMQPNENPTIIYSIYKDTDAQFVLFTTKNGLVKKTPLDEYVKTKKKTGIAAIGLREGDSLASVCLIKDEPIILITANGMSIKFDTKDISPTSRTATGVKGITLAEGDYVVTALPIREATDKLAVFSKNGMGKKIDLSEFPTQRRAGKGLYCYKPTTVTGLVTAGSLVSEEDSLLILGDKNSICIAASDMTEGSRVSIGTQIIKNSNINSVSKV